MRDEEGNSSIIERFDELTKMIYCKIHDEREPNPLERHQAFRIRAADTDDDVATKVKALFAHLVASNPELFPERFSDFKIGNHTIRRLAEELNLVRLATLSEDLKGLVYEEVIRNTFDKGENQQFFTPKPIVEFMVHMMRPRLSGTICDPACGTGGFLVYVQEYLKQNGTPDEVVLQGWEIDERLAWVAGVNLDVNETSIPFRTSFVEPPGTLGTATKPYHGSVDAIITNPPFGSDLTEKEALENLQLGKGRASRRRGVLFIERCLELLKPRGTLAIIIDDSVLNSATNSDTRQLLFERAHPLAIISLPETAFMPYASVKASILFLRKRGPDEQHEPSIHPTFFAEAMTVGRKPNGDALLIFNQATGNMEPDSNLPTILSAWLAGPKQAATTQTCGEPYFFWTQMPDSHNEEFSSSGLRLDPSYHRPERARVQATLKLSRYPLKALQDICTVRNESVVPSRDLQGDQEITYLGLASIESYTGNCFPTLVKSSSLQSNVMCFFPGDILFAKMRPNLRKVCLISDEVGEGFASGECLVLTPNTNKATNEPIMLPELLTILLRSDLANDQIHHLVTGIGRPRLSKTAALNVRLPLPPIGEQLRLLKQYDSADASAQYLSDQAERALKQAAQIRVEAKRNLIDNVLSPAEE